VKCVVCKHGDARSGTTTVTLTRNGTTLVVQGVPARVCSNCDEEYVDELTTARLLARTIHECTRPRARRLQRALG